MLQRLADREVGILHVGRPLRPGGVLADDRHLDGVFDRDHLLDQLHPVGPVLQGVKPEHLHQVQRRSLLLQEEGDLVDVVDVVVGDDPLHRHVAEEGDLRLRLVSQGRCAPDGDDVGLEAQGPHLLDAVLGRLRLLLAVGRRRSQGDVDEGDVSHLLVPQLPHRLEERHPLDVADGAADLDDADVAAALPATRLIRSLISLVMWGMIWTVLPRYSPRRSFSMTVL